MVKWDSEVTSWCEIMVKWDSEVNSWCEDHGENWEISEMSPHGVRSW